MSELIVRKASLDDVKGIVKVYCPNVKERFKCVNSKKVRLNIGIFCLFRLF